MPDYGLSQWITPAMLSQAKLDAIVPMDKPYKLFDTDGLYLVVNPNGSHWWRLKYRYGGKEKGLSLGVYPLVSLTVARQRRDHAREQLRSGIDPSAVRAEAKQTVTTAKGQTFAVVAQEWQAIQAKIMSQATVDKTDWLFNTYLYPKLADIPVSEVTAPLVLAVLREIEAKGLHETTARAKHRVSQVLRYAVATGRTGVRDVTVDLKGALIPVRQKHHPAITEPVELAPLLKAIRTYPASVTVKHALMLSSLIFLRPGELRQIEWTDVNLIDNEIRLPAHKMKTKKPHIIPLARQAVQLLTAQRKHTGNTQYVFPNERGVIFPMSDGALARALDRLGYADKHTAHGFRATARTILDEVLQCRVEWIEAQLAHEVRDSNGRAYNRTAFLADRCQMMQAWADYLDKLCS